ncbi:MAG: hypothetical protein LBS62_12170 [Clostridiales bacterium]|jgi:SAM-dependent methyltransferase|nr:hypothetical protein [Clostridiales bacterium]
MFHINRELYNYIFNELGARYEQMTRTVEFNLYNDREKNLKYLGTYFPRSFVESYKIFNNVFECFKTYHFDFDETINILDIGSGTGGPLFGLLQVLSEQFEHRQINVYSIDGNQDAFNIQSKISFYNNGLLYGNKSRPAFYFRPKIFVDKNDLKSSLLSFFQQTKIDIMMSFKFINELYPTNAGIYKTMLEVAEEILSSNGITCIVDLTHRKRDYNGRYLTDYLPVHFNKEVSEYFKSNRETTTLYYALPTCCAKNCCNCSHGRCFTSLMMPVQHDGFQDKTKINYKFFMKRGKFFSNFYCHYLTFANSDHCGDCKTNICHCDAMSSHFYADGDEHPLICGFENQPFSFKLW